MVVLKTCSGVGFRLGLAIVVSKTWEKWEKGVGGKWWEWGVGLDWDWGRVAGWVLGLGWG